MLSGQVNWTEPSDAPGERVVRENVVKSAELEAPFEVLYAALVGLSDEPCSATEISDNQLDTDFEGGLLGANDPEVLSAAVNIGSSVREYPWAGTHRDNQPTLAYFGPRYSGSSMDRLVSKGRVAQVEATPFLATDSQLAAPDPRSRNNVNTVRSMGSVVASAMPSNSIGVFDKSQLSTWMDAHALSRSSHHCAMYCRLGMEAAGLNTRDRPASGDAGDYGPFLLRHGAKTVPQDSYSPQVGDVVVFDKTDNHPHGHIEMFDGQHWVSDFMQHSFSPYHDASSSPPFTIYRLA